MKISICWNILSLSKSHGMSVRLLWACAICKTNTQRSLLFERIVSWKYYARSSQSFNIRPSDAFKSIRDGEYDFKPLNELLFHPLYTLIPFYSVLSAVLPVKTVRHHLHGMVYTFLSVYQGWMNRECVIIRFYYPLSTPSTSLSRVNALSYELLILFLFYILHTLHTHKYFFLFLSPCG